MQRLIIGLCLALAASVRGAEIRFDFTDSLAGSAPTNFHAALAGSGQPGTWKILMDDVPPLLAPLTDQAPSVNKRAVLAQTSQDPAGDRYPLFIYDGETFKDFKLTTRFKIVSGTAEQMAGVVFRFQNTSNFYVVRISALGRNIAFYKMVNGEITSPVRLPLEISTNVWHELKIDCSGVYVDCSLDGQKALPTITDKSPLDGKVGFWTKSDAVSYFCDPIIEYTPRIAAAQSLVRRILEQQPRILGLRIYTLDDHGVPHILASKDETEIGQPGTDAEKNAINDGKMFYAKNDGVVAVTLPFRDRNGDIMAAVRVRLDSFFGETQQNAVTRAVMVVKKMQGEVFSSEALLQ
jgi:hypothetical protein